MQDVKEFVVEIEKLGYSIDGVEILKGIYLKIRRGEFVGLIGPNGAGKTTLLKCINGINKATGDIRLNDERLALMSHRKIAREIALMYQNTSISFPFPSIDVVMMGRYAHLGRFGMESREDYRVARKHMEYTDTLKFENRPVTQISGGERQRVIFAKVLAQEADILLLDEPTASLDISHQEQIFNYSRELCAAGKTVIAAVHDLKIASRYCTRLVLMKEGVIVAEGSPEEVLTSRNLSKAYNVNALVYRNRITGLLDFHIHNGIEEKGKYRVHVIGGGGSASGIIRLLFENGFEVSSGVFAHGDSDIDCAEVFGIEYVACKPFSEIFDDAFAENIKKIEEADLTIFCNMPFGGQNYRNLEAAMHAGRLVIIEDDPPEARDFTGGKALKLYYELRKRAEITTSARLHEVL